MAAAEEEALLLSAVALSPDCDASLIDYNQGMTRRWAQTSLNNAILIRKRTDLGNCEPVAEQNYRKEASMLLSAWSSTAVAFSATMFNAHSSTARRGSVFVRLLKRRSRATISEMAIYLVWAYLAGVAVLLPTPSRSCCGWGPVLTWLYCSKCRAWPRAVIIKRTGCSTE